MKRDRDTEPPQKEETMAESPSLFGAALAVFSTLSLCNGGSFLPLSLFCGAGGFPKFPNKKMWCEVW